MLIRAIAGVGAVILFAAGAILLWRGSGEGPLAPPPPPAIASAGPSSAPRARPVSPPASSDALRAQQHFARLDRDHDGRVTLAELYQSRSRAYGRLDADHDGRLSFEEWSAGAARRFGHDDSDHDRALSRAEYGAAAARGAGRRTHCNCGPRNRNSDYAASSRPRH